MVMIVNTNSDRLLVLLAMVALSTLGAVILRSKLKCGWIVAYSISVTVVVQLTNALRKRRELEATDAEKAQRAAEKSADRAAGGNRKQRKKNRAR